MKYYDKIYLGNDLKIAEKQNFLDIVKELLEAKKNNDFFVLVSSSIVFDRSLDRVYCETNEPNANTVSARFLAQVEKMVVGYEYGYVVRTQDLFSSLAPVFNQMLKFTDPVFPNESFYPLSDEVAKNLTDFTVFDGSSKITHICSNAAFDLHLLWFMLSQQNSLISDDKCSLHAYKGRLTSTFLSDKPFYKDIMRRNKNTVTKSIFEIGESYGQSGNI
jgi:hypothetical protein